MQILWLKKGITEKNLINKTRNKKYLHRMEAIVARYV